MDQEEEIRQCRLAKALLQQAFGTERIRSDFTLVEAIHYVLDNLQDLARPQPFYGNFH